MKLRINANTIALRRFLEVDEMGGAFLETAGIGTGLQRFSFEQIDAVLTSSDSILSIQVGRTIYKLPYNAKNKEHQAALRMLIDGCRRRQETPA